MAKASAEALSMAGDKYIGRSYSEMDCQAFVEACLRDVGIRKDLKGSNAWWRLMTWTGTPEECVKTFGEVPKGAFLYILKNDGGEEARGYHDGKGNASHIGIVTHRNDGAIHSSASRGCVATSKFNNKTIPNGGWNRVGLWDQLDYGKGINWVLDHMGIGGEPEQKKEERPMALYAVTRSGNGKSINLRKAKNGELLDRVPDGTTVEVLEPEDEWTKIRWNGKTGWMVTGFLVMQDPDDDFSSGDLNNEPAAGGKVALYFTMDELGAALPFLDGLVDQIVAKIGRG